MNEVPSQFNGTQKELIFNRNILEEKRPAEGKNSFHITQLSKNVKNENSFKEILTLSKTGMKFPTGIWNSIKQSYFPCCLNKKDRFNLLFSKALNKIKIELDLNQIIKRNLQQDNINYTILDKEERLLLCFSPNYIKNSELFEYNLKGELLYDGENIFKAYKNIKENKKK